MEEFHLKDEVTILDPKVIKIDRDTFGDLVLTYGDQTHHKVRVLRTFPLTHPDKYLVFQTEDEELGMLEDSHKLPRASRKVMEDELRKAYFIPRITRIISLEESYGSSKWKVQTDHGEREFDIRSRDDIKPVPPFRVLFRDADGNRYEIPDSRRLDGKSRSLLETET